MEEVKLAREPPAATTASSAAEMDATLGDAAVRIADHATKDSVVVIATDGASIFF